MEQTSFKVYGYRWIMLLAFMFVVAVNQLLWITFAPITGSAARYYGVSDLSIGLLSMIFMIVYIVISIPASWAIDTYGIRVAVGIGAALTGIFGLLRGLVASDYTLVLISQIGIAIGQPFILNAVTTVAARWFPIQERATAAGLGSLAMYLGIFVGLALTPYLTIQSGIGSMLVIYGIVSVIAAVVFFGVARERPPTPPCPPGQEERSLVLDGLKQTLRKRDFCPPDAHLLRGPGGVQCGDDVDRRHRKAKRILDHPGRNHRRPDDRGRHHRRPGHPLALRPLSQASSVPGPGPGWARPWDWSASPMPRATGSCSPQRLSWVSSCSAQARSDSSMALKSPIRRRKARPMVCFCSWGKSRGLFSSWGWTASSRREQVR